MHKCPHCYQELHRFAFYCIRCGRQAGKVQREEDMLVVCWTDRDGNPSEQFRLKTLKRHSGYANLNTMFPECQPSPEDSSEKLGDITFTLRDEDKTSVSQSLLEFFEEASNDTEEWTIS